MRSIQAVRRCPAPISCAHWRLGRLSNQLLWTSGRVLRQEPVPLREEEGGCGPDAFISAVIIWCFTCLCEWVRVTWHDPASVGHTYGFSERFQATDVCIRCPGLIREEALREMPSLPALVGMKTPETGPAPLREGVARKLRLNFNVQLEAKRCYWTLVVGEMVQYQKYHHCIKIRCERERFFSLQYQVILSPQSVFRSSRQFTESDNIS